MTRLAVAGLFGVAIFLTYSPSGLEATRVKVLNVASNTSPIAALSTDQSEDPRTALPAARQPISTNYASEAIVVLNTEINTGERRASLHRLVAAGRPAAGALIAIARAPLKLPPGEARPHSVQEMKGKTERSLRVTALEALDRLATTNPDIAAQIVVVADQQGDPMLRFLAQVSATGIQQGRPGKLGRMIDKIVQ